MTGKHKISCTNQIEQLSGLQTPLKTYMCCKE